MITRDDIKLIHDRVLSHFPEAADAAWYVSHNPSPTLRGRTTTHTVTVTPEFVLMHLPTEERYVTGQYLEVIAEAWNNYERH